ncbi:TPA: hypothetical protein ACN1M8_002562 [Enterococcus faecium]|uniref:hypothetical protein n=1 Tax=Enterococcus TaxID=1350 RepID=UPI0009C0C25D|nr:MULTISPECIES: hypothetical protein [Enterococcus]EGP5595288.1 hypothetical protein [Enterococcus faecium]OQO64436.1 hypothetical protein BH743_12180 [Enterococcus faecium]OTO22024.1 hypothetical protein A5816_003070 [Enterococcus sp. 3G1_DIV0629]
MKFNYNSLGDGFYKNIDLEEANNLVTYYETDILKKIAQQKDKKLSVAKYISNFNMKEKRCFLGLLKRFKQVRVVYDQEDGISRQYLVEA